MLKSKWKFVIPIFLIFMVGFFSSCSGDTAGTATTDPIIPKFTEESGYVIDLTGKLDSEIENNWERILRDYDSEGSQIVIIIANNLPGAPGTYCTEVLNENGIGDADLDDGFAICVFLEKEGRGGVKPALGTSTGAGLAGQLSASRLGGILDDTFAPARADGEWEEGLTQLLISYGEFRAEEFAILDSLPSEAEPLSAAQIFGIIVVIIIVLVILYFDGRYNNFEFVSTVGVSLISSRLGKGGSSNNTGVDR